jgi:hypothetical protein
MPRTRRDRRAAVLVGLLLAGALVASCSAGAGKPTLAPDGSSAAADVGRSGATTSGASTSNTTTANSAPPSTVAAFAGWSDPGAVGKPYGTKVEGLLTFRGNPTRTYYGEGPVPKAPKQLWRFPKSGGLCATSIDTAGPSVWCGNGWTGEPAIFERDGRTWVVFGAYDKNVHFLDATTGERILEDFPTGDIIKGSVTIDPDGYPLVYTGSRDNYFRVLSIDQGVPKELWKLSAYDVSPTLWNDDWDGSALVIGDYLFEGGENSWIYIVKLNRGYDAQGKVTVAPQVVWQNPGWDSELLSVIGDKDVSIENSVAMYKNILYFANSGGLVQGWDVGGIKFGLAPTRVFRFWTGDDTDASVVIDADGFLYVASEYERGNERSRQMGQLMKLDPSKPDDPLVWKVDERPTIPAGIWGTPALYKDLVIADTNNGRVFAADKTTGVVRWEFKLPGPTWQSPVVVDDILLLGDCSGVMHAYDVSDTTKAPVPKWTLNVGGCIEATPAVWKGKIIFGTRAGGIHAFSD